MEIEMRCDAMRCVNCFFFRDGDIFVVLITEEEEGEEEGRWGRRKWGRGNGGGENGGGGREGGRWGRGKWMVGGSSIPLLLAG